MVSYVCDNKPVFVSNLFYVNVFQMCIYVLKCLIHLRINVTHSLRLPYNTNGGNLELVSELKQNDKFQCFYMNDIAEAILIDILIICLRKIDRN